MPWQGARMYDIAYDREKQALFPSPAVRLSMAGIFVYNQTIVSEEVSTERRLFRF